MPLSLFHRHDVRIRPLLERGHQMTVGALASLTPPENDEPSLNLKEVVAAIRASRERGQAVILMLGGHPIKLGLSRYLVDLIERRWVTHVATNGAGIIHDFELALVGGTSEDVAKWIREGQFGLWRETSRLNDGDHRQTIPALWKLLGEGDGSGAAGEVGPTLGA